MERRISIVGLFFFSLMLLLMPTCGGSGGGKGGANIAISRNEAFQKVSENLIAPMTAEEKALLVVFSPRDPLASGVTVTPAFPEVDPETDASLGFRHTKTLDKPAWFFFLDTDYSARFGHKTIFAFVYGDGSIEYQEQQWWPVIGTSAFMWNTQQKKGTDLLVYPESNPYLFQAAETNPPGAVTTLGPVAKTKTNGAASCYVQRGVWLIKGGDDSDFQADIDEVKDLMTDTSADGGFGVGPGFVFESVGRDLGPGGTAQTIINEWKEKVQEINQTANNAQKVCYEEFFIYYSGHGPETGGFALGESEDSDTVIGIPSFARIISKICAKKIVLMVDACFAGLWIDVLKREGTNRCADFVVIASSSSEKRSKTRDFGFYTSAFSRRIREQNRTYADAQRPLDDKLQIAHNNTLGAVFQWGAALPGYLTHGVWEQDPQFAKIPKNPGEDCCNCTCPQTPAACTDRRVSFLVTPDFGSAVHTVGSSPCPQTIENHTITNTGTETFTCSISSSDASFGTTSSGCGQLAPNQSFNFSTRFTCDSAAPRTETGVVTIRTTAVSTGTECTFSPVSGSVSLSISVH